MINGGIMITYLEGDIFRSPAQVLVNTVNTVGVMGKGLALEFKNKYPEMFVKYKELCKNNSLSVGKLMLWYDSDYWLLQFPTKENWRNPSKIEYIEKGLATFVKRYSDYNISSIAFPKLGCGNGGLNWTEVKDVMEKYLSDLPISVYIYLDNKESLKENGKFINKMLDISFSGMKKFLTIKNPIVFKMDENEWNVYLTSNDEIFFENNNSGESFGEEKAHNIWDDVYNKKVFPVSVDERDNLFYGFLEFLGYLQKVKIQSDNRNKEDGYQLDMGKGRKFLIA